MRVEALELRGFRNLSQLSLQPSARFNVLFGDNGAGKSSILEALSYVSALESFRSAKKEDMVQRGAGEARIGARVSGAGLAQVVRIALPRDSARKVEVDGKRPSTLGGYFTAFPSVLFHPADAELMAGGPEARRALLDRMLSQLSASYARIRAEYEKAVRSRNRMLKAERVDRLAVAAYDALLAERGASIGAARRELTAQLKPLVEAHFAEITEHALPIRVEYAMRTEPSEAALLAALGASFERDVARGFTSVGPHGDDLVVEVERTRVKHFASQGQHRAIVLALKVAELSVLSARSGRVPMLLLDDVSSELDRSRNRRLFGLLGRLGGQVFLTTTHPEFILLSEQRSDFEVSGGAVRRV